MKSLALILILLLNVTPVFSLDKEGGGDRVGNGGDVVLCLEHGEEKYYVLDEYKSDSPLEIGEKTLHYSIKVIRLLERIREHFPARYDAYINIYNNFRANVTYTNASLPEIDDEGSENTEGCTKIQAAYFTRNLNGNYVYFIQKKIWNLLDSDQQAVLLLHEIMYTETIGLGTFISSTVREANRILFNSSYFDPTAFDNQFLFPVQYTGTFGHHIDQFLNAYSERIAINLLDRNWTRLYDQKRIILNLEVLKNRFSSNISVTSLVDEHIRNIQAISKD
jgi:hypothetical protein